MRHADRGKLGTVAIVPAVSAALRVALVFCGRHGKEATIGIVSEGNFFGEGSLAGQLLRMGSAAAMTDCELMRIDKKAMMTALHREHAFSDLFALRWRYYLDNLGS